MSTTPTARRRVITRQVVEWAAWDWGSAAFNAVATTFVFTTYLTSDGVFTDSGTASTWLSNGMTIAGLFIALLAPITGQRADRRGRGGVWLGWFTGLVVACMLAMYFVHPESVLGPRGALMLGIALLGLGNVFFEFASVNYNAMLNHLGEKEDRGKISGFGWASGYIGGIVLLLILYVGLIGANLLGVPTDEPFDFNFDCATSITQNGKIEYYARIGEDVHPGTVIGRDGQPISGDSGEALKKIRSGDAALTTLGGIGEALGGYKGYGYAMVIELLSAVLQDGAYGKDLDGKDENGNIRPYHLGHFFIAIDTDHFLGQELTRKKAGEILRSVRASQKAPGADRIFTAGEKEWEIWQQRKDSGVPINDSVQKEILEVRDELGLTQYKFPWE